MNFGAARLGFWFRPVGDRSVTKSPNVLIVYDPNSVHPGIYGSDVNPADIASSITAQETGLGFTATTVTSYAALNALDITNYSHIWDVGYDTLITTTSANQYLAYLQTGGAIFLLGENGVFVDRDNSLDNFISVYAGGGAADADNWDPMASITATVAAEFLLANSVNTVTFNRPGRYVSVGTGTAMATSVNGTHAAVWETGSLSAAPTGAIASVLDINWTTGGDLDPNFMDNISITLNKK